MEKKMETTIVYWGYIGVPYTSYSVFIDAEAPACWLPEVALESSLLVFGH